MKNALLLALALTAGASQAQLFQSGFETWNAGVPEGWGGSKTSTTPTFTYTETTTDPHAGTSAASIHVANESHQRLTTLPLTVTSGNQYTVSFWVRGTGSIRAGLFDNRVTASGYAYGSYVDATSTWALVTQQILADNDYAAAEFIISTKGTTTTPADVVVDDVTITENGAAVPVSIYSIQFTTDPSGDSPLAGQNVLVGGIVSAVDSVTNGATPVPQNVYYLQDAPGAWNGIYVFDYPSSPNHPQIGDSIVLSASVTEYFGITELSNITSFQTVQSGLAPHAPLVILSGEVANEALESVLVQVQNANCTVIPSGATFGKWNADDGSGDAIIGKEMYTTTPAPILGQSYNVTGIVSFGFDEYAIQPRMASDVEIASSIADAGVLATVQVGPNPATEQLTVNLGQAANTSVSYTLTDLQGRTLQSGVFTGERGELQVASMATGFYHLTLRSAKMVKSFGVQVVR
ncbi:MAG: T9SS type A sorting domain-containing protein [Flavobacteriales bacterium]|nr:T9SS type A sorting domain-containing protein [Flavobacteriales bacterium]